MDLMLNEDTLEVPLSDIQDFNGLSMDIGASVVKVVYLHNDDWQQIKHGQKEQTVKLRILSVGADCLTEALDHLEEHCHMKREEDTPTVNTVGVGAYEFRESIEHKLNVRIENQPEGQIQANALSYICSRISQRDMFYLLPNKDIRDAENCMTKSCHTLGEVTNHELYPLTEEDYTPVDGKRGSSQWSQPLVASEADVFPCLLVVAGSCIGYSKVSQGGENRVLPWDTLGGKSFQGLSYLLTGVKDYKEIASLLPKGSNGSLDFRFCDFHFHGEDDDAYGKAMTHMSDDPIYMFGKVQPGKKAEDFKKEDLIFTALRTLIVNLLTRAFHMAHMINTNHIFLAGGMFHSDTAKKLAATEAAKLRIQYIRFMGTGHKMKFHILKHAAHLGAIGGMIKDVKC